MSRKCSCCDTIHNLYFVPSDEDFMCGECYHEQYHRYEFNLGRYEAEADVQNSDVYDVEAALDAFISDPPDNAFQYGYLYELKSELENRSV